MPRKIRQLKAELRKAGFIEDADRGKGSHAIWRHHVVRTAFVTLSGNDGDDAKPYQEKDVRNALAQAKRTE